MIRCVPKCVSDRGGDRTHDLRIKRTAVHRHAATRQRGATPPLSGKHPRNTPENVGVCAEMCQPIGDMSVAGMASQAHIRALINPADYTRVTQGRE